MRKQLDIRASTERKPNSKTTTALFRLHPSGWISYRVGTKDGWYVFNRLRKNGSLGSRWIAGMSMTFERAISKARSWSGAKIPVKGWSALEVKHYNFTHVCKADILILIVTKNK